ncbi:small ribosomal subunit protein S13, mitochondrial-like [Argentina anserina]|uniref:small ribosomal subunit protein S13, mitochondrial-like n=1 Tax=Argentina anserina TaxID=57926 RepID=UPI0021769219|nr:small ribosomal subunit protein S13, mitochondrial-like [Potentilla anserina]XP_050364628.1 small ribosomal subunit protein S13, mitochondrial-like [Potentilla anserina]
MLGLRAVASNVGGRLLQSLPFCGIRGRCITIKAGMDIPDNKSLEYALPYIHGIGRARARHILSELHMDNKLAKDLTKREIIAIGEELSKYIIGRELNAVVEKDIRRMIDLQCYRGIRHSDGLPCRGQRTKTNARTRKAAKRIPYGGRSK